MRINLLALSPLMRSVGHHWLSASHQQDYSRSSSLMSLVLPADPVSWTAHPGFPVSQTACPGLPVGWPAHPDLISWLIYPSLPVSRLAHPGHLVSQLVNANLFCRSNSSGSSDGQFFMSSSQSNPFTLLIYDISYSGQRSYASS